jgi:dienelactone hydrolase
MQEYNKSFTYEIYSGAGHAFMRDALNPDASQANIDARTRAFQDMLVKLQKLYK